MTFKLKISEVGGKLHRGSFLLPKVFSGPTILGYHTLQVGGSNSPSRFGANSSMTEQQAIQIAPCPLNRPAHFDGPKLWVIVGCRFESGLLHQTG